MRKICILGNTDNNPFTAYSWFVRTVAQGMKLNDCEVVGFDYKSHSIDQISEFLFEYKPDILFTHLTFHMHKKLDDILSIFDSLRSVLDTKIIHTLQDAREEPRYNGDISSFFDMALVSQFENINKFSNYGKIPVYYWPYSSLTYNKMAKPNPKYSFDVPVFTGSEMSHEDRAKFIRNLKRKLSITIFTTKSKNDKRNVTKELSISTDCILGLSTRYGGGITGYIDVRPWQYLGTGACMIIRPHKRQNEIIPEDLHFTINGYKEEDIYDLKKIYYTKIKGKNTMSMRKRAFEFIQKYHSSKKRMGDTLDLIDGKINKLSIFLDEI